MASFRLEYAQPMKPYEGTYDAIILAGGKAQRLRGADKACLVIGNRVLLERAISAVADANRIVVVGPRRHCERSVIWTREDPPWGGPAAAVAAGVTHVTAPLVVVLAVDMPFATTAVPRLLSALITAPGADGVMLVDSSGRRQYLLSAYRALSLRNAVKTLGPMKGQSMRRFISDLDLVTMPASRAEAMDCDTHTQVVEAEAEAQRGIR